MSFSSTETTAPAVQHALVVPIRIAERSGITRIQEPVTVGIPLPKGECFDIHALGIRDQHGRCQPLQAQALARWSDTSLKWVLLDFQVTLESHETISLEVSLNNPMGSDDVSAGISVDRLGDNIVINTGIAQFTLSSEIVKPFDRVIVRGVEVAGNQGSKLVVSDAEGKEYLPYLRHVEVETAGRLRTTVCADGILRSVDGTSLAEFIVRLTFYAQRSDVQCEWTIRNSRAALHPRGLWDLGDAQSIYFRDCSLYLGLSSAQVSSVEWNVTPGDAMQSQSCQSLELYQDSSGGVNWQSPNHVNRLGTVTTSFPGYSVKLDGALIEQGRRATPTVRIRGEHQSLSVAVSGFWENFPKAIEVQNGEMVVRLFPRQYSDLFELQGGEQKTHTVFLQYDSFGEPSSLNWTHDRLVAMPPADWSARARAFGHVAALKDSHSMSECEMAAERLVGMAVNGKNTFFERREIVDEYGWRNFGDLYADHEAVNWKGDRPLVAHYNNQYDVIYGGIIQLVRSGDVRWYDLVRDLAKHVIDIDLYHTQNDRSALNGGLFWHTDHYTDAGTSTHRSFSITSPQAKVSSSYGGGPACEHNYATGLLYYYYLTGAPAAKEAVLSLADWVINMDDGSMRSCGWLDRRPTGYCSLTATQGYHGPGRGSGNSISVLLDAEILTSRKTYLAKAEQLIRRCIHPLDDIDGRNLADVEKRWSYTVFLQVLGKYLDVKIERNELDFMYAYARASLLHYASWMLEHEVPYQQVLDRVLIQTETWPAQDIRKANVFCLAARFDSSDRRQAFRKKADFFFDACITDLQSYDTHTLTRPLVLLMTNAYVYSYYRQHDDEIAPEPSRRHDFGKPKPFAAQFHEVYLLRDRVQAGLCLLRSAKAHLASFLKATKPDGEDGHA
ncbi:MAG: hypothetical protein E8D47_13260 [Nitrospira sp.]|nr:MAG: hypothetical protein E8D47_13260 [Nitrospira sp.]